MTELFPHSSSSNRQTNAARKAVFLDRDGTINVEKNYLFKVEDFEFYPGVIKALKRLQAAGYLLVVVTNQSGVARGYYALDDVVSLHNYMSAELEKTGVYLASIYVCPHHPHKGLPPYDVVCGCRKGKPGMLLQAADELNIDLTASFMVGDKLSDIEAGVAAGCRSILVRTGQGANLVLTPRFIGTPVFTDLGPATDFILAQGARKPSS